MNNATEKSVVDAVIAALNELGLDARVRHLTGKRVQGDAIVTVRHDSKTVRYIAEVKRRLTPAMVGPITVSLSHPDNDRLLLTDYVTPPMADAFRARGVQFADGVGNAFLNREGLLVIVTGRAPKTTTPRMAAPRVFRRSGLKILFALLTAPPLVEETQRTIAEAANVSLGTVGPFLEGLRELGFLAEAHGKRRLVDRARLIDQWSEAYARVLEPSLEIGRFVAKSADWWRHTDPTAYAVQWGGETAASVLQRHLRPERTVLYADGIPTRLFTEERMKADPAGNVILRQRFWNAAPSPRVDVVSPLLIYADLVANGDARTFEAARQIREAYLD
jgi:hypothetical protein